MKRMLLSVVICMTLACAVEAQVPCINCNNPGTVTRSVEFSVNNTTYAVPVMHKHVAKHVHHQRLTVRSLLSRLFRR